MNKNSHYGDQNFTLKIQKSSIPKIKNIQKWIKKIQLGTTNSNVIVRVCKNE